MAKAKMVVSSSGVTSGQLKDFFRQIDDGSITGAHLTALLEHQDPFGRLAVQLGPGNLIWFKYEAAWKQLFVGWAKDSDDMELYPRRFFLRINIRERREWQEIGDHICMLIEAFIGHKLVQYQPDPMRDSDHKDLVYEIRVQS